MNQDNQVNHLKACMTVLDQVMQLRHAGKFIDDLKVLSDILLTLDKISLAIGELSTSAHEVAESAVSVAEMIY